MEVCFQHIIKTIIKNYLDKSSQAFVAGAGLFILGQNYEDARAKGKRESGACSGDASVPFPHLHPPH